MLTRTRYRLPLLILVWVLLLGVLPAEAQENAEARLKDLVSIEGAAPVHLTGYGLVVGLDRTGDRARGARGAPYTVQGVANMLRRFGITVDPNLLTSRNVAAVMVTARMEPFSGPGTEMDVTVSAMGDAQSLSGGVLLQTPLLDPASQEIYAMAQGPVATGAVRADARGASVRINQSNTGRIPGGAVISQPLAAHLDDGAVNLNLRRPDFTNAREIAQAINELYPNSAQVAHAGQVQVEVPSAAGGTPALMADLESLLVEVDVPARVIVNERTGTIVAGGNVRINEVMVTYGSLIVMTREEPVIAQPLPFTDGETVVEGVGEVTVEEEGTRSVVLEPNTSVAELAAALNELGLSSRDVISIFQAIDRAGALQGELQIM